MRLARFPTPKPTSSTRHRLAANEDGAAAIEFALVGLPFLLFIFGIIGFGLYFLTSTYLEHGVKTASRKILTGELRTAGTDGNPMTIGEFRKLVCDASEPVIDCSKLSVMVQHATDWSSLSPQSCIDEEGNMAGSTGESGDLLSQYSGEASEVVLVTVCYNWELANTMSFLKLGSGADGSGPAIMQAAMAFKSEPYS
ncbi:TadE/TadG family type IV pilus assembly protein [Hyphomicrobium sp. NDB2Meth4]|uniref:TadE/TadG family type IV pilus assembly protein n=1 Tax=Hyphomicrobium sp. NDB2Meth4 TaxID=1892846 RepID=UPI0009F83DD1|nr:TadE/TadG family type IV pilus assembly protein [Hyphomicrobium sp. NDB2Meth4]